MPDLQDRREARACKGREASLEGRVYLERTGSWDHRAKTEYQEKKALRVMVDRQGFQVFLEAGDLQDCRAATGTLESRGPRAFRVRRAPKASKA